MIALVFLGLLFLSFSYAVPVSSGEVMEVIPDFVGFLLLWLGMEKAKPLGGRMKVCSYIAGGLIAVHFLVFLGQLDLLLPSFSLDDLLIFKVFFGFIGDIYSAGEAWFVFANFVFAAFLAFAFKEESDYDGRVLESVIFFICGILMIGGGIFCAVHFFAEWSFSFRYVTVPAMLVFALCCVAFGDRLRAFGGKAKEQ